MNTARKKLLFTLTLLVVMVASLSAVLMVPSFARRGRVIGAKLAGKLPELPFVNLAAWLAPGSAMYLEELAMNPNVNAGIRNLLTGRESIARGKELFSKSCGTCHGDDALGRSGPNLLSSVSNSTDWAFFSVTKWGRKGTSMAGQELDDGQIWQVHAFLRDLALAAARPKHSGAAAVSRSFAPATAILASDRTPDLWLTYAGNYAGHRHTRLTKIEKGTVGDLSLAWAAQLRTADTPLQSSPIVSGGLVFVTESRDGVVAFEARSGKRIWEYRRPVPDGLPLCCGSPNRGAAILGDTLYVATLDSHLVALDAATGKERWIVKVAEPRDGYSMTGA